MKIMLDTIMIISAVLFKDATIGKFGRSFPCKLILLWVSHVGTSTLIMNSLKSQLSEFQAPTLPSAYFTQIISSDDKRAKYGIWNSTGQERYNSLAPM